MRKLRTLLVKMVCALAGGLMLSACSSEEGGSQAMGGKGAVILDLAAETVFDTKTKAVDESTYLTDRPLADYKVKILDAQGHVVSGCEWKYSERPTGLIELSNGSYTVVASDGEEFNVNASTRNGIYMYGSSRFDVNSDKVAAVNVACKPACGKLVVELSGVFQGADIDKDDIRLVDGLKQILESSVQLRIQIPEDDKFFLSAPGKLSCGINHAHPLA